MAKSDSKLDKLNLLYALYERFMDETESVCRKGCSSCCTCNVTLTSLELDHIKSFLEPDKAGGILDLVKNNLSEKRFQPKTTMNGFARSCMEGNPIHEEENNPQWGACPLLSDHLCTIYPVRPFGCRCLVSTEDCVFGGAATISPFTLTVSNVFMQYIEHLDCGGVSGNLTDMFLSPMVPGSCQGSLYDAAHGIIKNQEAKILMVPPEHREKIWPLVQEINRICNPI